MSRRMTFAAAASLTLALLASGTPIAPTKHVVAQEEPLPASATGRVRVVFADAAAAGITATKSRSHLRAVRIFERDPGKSVNESVQRWKRVRGVISARPEIRFTATTIDDTEWSKQWDMIASETASSRAETAWATTTGSSEVVVAVLDTGRTNHPDLVDAMPNDWGADMVSDAYYADDEDGRDTDPTDTGDWCGGETSSWHGTHVAGTIAAQHNAQGVRGIAPGIKLMHVRVLAHCGGDDVDIVDGIRWAAGLTTDSNGDGWGASGLATNPHPADVINLSLGGPGKCSSSYFSNYRAAIAAARAAGTVIVVAAGNDYGQNVANYMPASCADVVTVAAVGPTGARAYYSNIGMLVDIAAPGGDDRYVGGEIYSTIAIGDYTLEDYGYTYYQGTSMATPHVTGAVALLRSIWPDSTAAQVETELRLTARSFPGACSGCGVGLLDIAALVSRSEQATLSIDNDPTVTLGVGISTTIALEGGSGSGATSLATNTPTICSIRGMVVTGRKVGTCTISASKARSATNFPTTSEPVALTVIVPPKATRLPVATLSLDKLSVAVTDGTWSGGGTITYEWYRCTSSSRTASCTLIGGETASGYSINRPGDVAAFIRAKVINTNLGISVAAWSNATPKILAL